MTAQEEIEKLKKEMEKITIENALLTKLLLGQHSQAQPGTESVSFIDAYSRWLKSRQGHLQLTTFFEYNRIFEVYITPYWQPKNLMISEIKPGDIEEYYSFLKATYGMSNNTLIRHHSNLHSCFKFSYKKDWIPSKVIDKVTRPKEDAIKKFNYYTIEELLELFELAKGTKIYLPILLAAILGFSRSELLGIKWDAINFNAGTITVMRKVTRDKKKRKDVVSRNLKTKARERTLVLPPFLLSYLLEVKNRTAALSNLDYAEFICVDPDGSRPSLSAITDRFRRFIQKHGLKKIRLHDLRHSCASMLLTLGYSMKDIQEWLGHSNYQTTANIYTHVNIEDKKRIAKRLQEVIGDGLYGTCLVPSPLLANLKETKVSV